MAKQTSLFDGVQISLIFGLVWAGLTDYLFVLEVCNRFINSGLLCEACIWSTDLYLVMFWELHYIGNCIALGFALFWEFTAIEIVLYCELHCIGNCIVLRFAMYWKLHCIENWIVLGIALYWELHCIRNCIVLRIALYWELHCIEWSLEYSRNFCGEASWQLLVVVVFV